MEVIIAIGIISDISLRIYLQRPRIYFTQGINVCDVIISSVCIIVLIIGIALGPSGELESIIGVIILIIRNCF